MESREQKLIEMKKKLLKAVGDKQSEEIILRLEEISRILSTKDLSEKVEKMIIEKIETRFPDKMEISNLKEIPAPTIKTETVQFPDSVIVSNLKDYKPVVKVTERVVDVANPIKTLYKSLQGFLQPFIDKVMIYIAEPDRTTIDKDTITDYYGSRKIEYKLIRRYGKIKEIVRNER